MLLTHRGWSGCPGSAFYQAVPSHWCTSGSVSPDAARTRLGGGRVHLLEFRPPVQEGDPFDTLAAELVRLPVDIIVATGTRAVRATKQVTNTIPIVMSAAPNVVEDGLVASLARPGGNITGLSAMGAELSGKRLEILTRHRAERVTRGGAVGPATERQLHAVRAAAQALDVHFISSLPVVQRTVCKAWADTRPVQIAWAES